MLASNPLRSAAMNQRITQFCTLWLFLILLPIANSAWCAEPKVQILSPKNGDRVAQDQKTILVSDKVASESARSPNVDIFLVIDISGSTSQYAGIDLGDAAQPDSLGSSGFPRPQISIGGFGLGGPSPRNLRNSILATEVAAARRLLVQLNSQTTRVGVITFSEGARLLQPLSHDFEQVRRALDDILRAGPNGGTNMVEGIRTGISELMGLGTSEKRTDAVKVEFLLTDGFPTLPIGGGSRMAPEDTDLAINAARLAGKAGIKVHVFALGEEALSYTRAAVGIAHESGGTYIPVSRAADVLAVVENISVVGVEYVQIVNQTTGQKATQTRLAADGFFSSAVQVVEGRNQIDVIARASDGSTGRDSITLYYQSGNQTSLESEVFLEREKTSNCRLSGLATVKRNASRKLSATRKTA